MTAPGQAGRPQDSYEQRLAALERKIDEHSRRDLSNSVVSAGGLFRILNPNGHTGLRAGPFAADPTKSVLSVNDNNGAPMVSVDYVSGYGLGNPTLAYPYAGFESLNLTGATSVGTATEVGVGRNWVYNPALSLMPRVRWFSSTAATVWFFAIFQAPSGTHTTAGHSYALPAAGADIEFPGCAALFQAQDMAEETTVSFRAYCSAGTASNVNVTMTFYRGSGVSKGYYDLIPADH